MITVLYLSILSAYSFNEGEIGLIERVAAAGNPPNNTTSEDAFATTDGWIDLWLAKMANTRTYSLD